MEPVMDLADLLLLAEDVLDVPAERVRLIVQIPLAQSALAAPFATYGGLDFYPEAHEKVGVLGARIIRNHVLIVDGNKRLALLAMIELGARLGYQWIDPPGGQEETAAVLEMFTAREIPERDLIQWVAARLAPFSTRAA